jgi:hypothetical protein
LELFLTQPNEKKETELQRKRREEREREEAERCKWWELQVVDGLQEGQRWKVFLNNR